MIETRREDTVAKLWNITETLNVLYRKNWTKMVRREMIKFQNEIVEAAKRQMEDTKDTCKDAEKNKDEKMSIMGSFLFCLSLITTVGKTGLCLLCLNYE